MEGQPTNSLTRLAWLETSSLLVAELPSVRRAPAADFRGAPPGEWVGLNTTVKGFGLDQSIAASRENEFGTVEIHLFGRLGPRPDKPPDVNSTYSARTSGSD